MDNAALAEFLHLTPAEAEIVIPKITPEKRAVYERMNTACNEIALWQAGLGPKPKDVIVCGARQIRLAGSRNADLSTGSEAAEPLRVTLAKAKRTRRARKQNPASEAGEKETT